MNTNTYRKIVTVNYEDNGYLRLNNLSNEPADFYFASLWGDYNNSTMNFEYSLDGVNWLTANVNKFSGKSYAWGYAGYGKKSEYWITKVGPKRNIYLRGVNSKLGNQYCTWGIYMNKPHTASGNMLSLIDYNNMNNITSLPNNCFGFCDFDYGMQVGTFMEDTNLISVKDLNFGNVTTLGNQALAGLFKNCSNLIDAPDFSKFTTIGNSSLRGTFKGCNSLNYNIDLSSVTTVDDNGLREILYSCTSFNGNVDLSNVTSIGASALYAAFRGCSAMTTMPSLGAITSIPSGALREAFYGCQNLNGNVDLSSVTTVDGSGLRETFYNCQNLNGNVDLSSMTTLADYGMYQTFYNCYNLDGVINMSQLSQISGQSLNGTFRSCRALTQAPSFANLTTFNGGNCMTNTYRDCYLLQEVTAPNMNPWDPSQSMSWMENAGRDVPAGTQKTAYVPSGVAIDAGPDGIPSDWTQVPY